MIRAVVCSLIAMTAFGASAAGGFAWANSRSETVARDPARERIDVERQAHLRALDRIEEEFSEKPLERMQFTGYERAIHAAMIAEGPAEMREAARNLVRAQECAGIMYGGHRTTITRELILDIHRAVNSNPRWRRILMLSSTVPSGTGNDPCRSESEVRAAPNAGMGIDPMIVDRSTRTMDTNIAPHGERMGTYHVAVTPETKRLLDRQPHVRSEDIRIRLD
jgi:hypothetical protein